MELWAQGEHHPPHHPRAPCISPPPPGGGWAGQRRRERAREAAQGAVVEVHAWKRREELQHAADSGGAHHLGSIGAVRAEKNQTERGPGSRRHAVAGAVEEEPMSMAVEGSSGGGGWRRTRGAGKRRRHLGEDSAHSRRSPVGGGERHGPGTMYFTTYFTA